MRLTVPLLALATAACVAAPHRGTLAAPAPTFDVERFFVGHTQGDGRLSVVASHQRAVQVDGTGRMNADGTLTLDQHVTTQGQAARDRTWRMRAQGDDRWGGSLSDASGPLVAQVTGNCLHLRYPAKGHLAIEQWIFLQPGGQVALNRMVVRKFGVRVARLDETIRRVGQAG